MKLLDNLIGKENKPMKFNKKTKYSFLAALTLLNIVMRWPWYHHEVGTDSFYIHSMANSISYYGMAKWVINPFSFVGLTPDTYPAGFPFLISEFSQISGLTIEHTIMLFGMIIGIFGLFTMYTLAAEFFEDDLIRLLCAFGFSLSPVYLWWTVGSSTPRILFICLIPLFLFFLIRSLKNKKAINVTIIVALFLIMYSIHRMTLLLIGPVAIFIFVHFLYNIEKTSNKIIWRSLIISLIPLMIFFYFLQVNEVFFYNDLGIAERYQTGFFFTGDSFIPITMNMLADYGSRFGLIFFISIIGFIVVGIRLFNQRNDFKQPILFFPIVLAVPLILFWGYISQYLLIFFSVCIGYGALFLLRQRTPMIRVMAVCLISLLFVSSIGFSLYMTEHWKGLEEDHPDFFQVNPFQYDSALYLNENDKNHDITTNNFWQIYITPYSNNPPEFRSSENVTLTPGSFRSLALEDTLYEETGVTRELSILEYQNWTDEKLNKKIYENRPIFIRNNRIPDLWHTHNGIKNSTMVSTVDDYKYKIYDTEKLSIFCL